MKGAESNIIVIFYFSLVTEKAVAAQLCDYLNGNEGLFEEFQSAYNCYHSTETARVRVHNDILKAVESLLLDLSAAFDTVDHTILVSRLTNRFGIMDHALNWFRSYLKLRKQFVFVNGIDSSLKDLQYGIPQGSVLGPLLFSLYTSPLGDLARKHGIPFHLMQMIHSHYHYLSFKSNCPEPYI